jgi:hypothetical protein
VRQIRGSRHRLPRRDRLVERGHDLGRQQLERAAGELLVLPVVAGVEQGAEIAELMVDVVKRRVTLYIKP